MRRFYSVICLLIVTNFFMKLYSQNISKYEIFELTLTASGSYSNPYLQMPGDSTSPGFVVGTFINSSAQDTIIIDGFWYSGSTWKIRMAPTSLGTWIYSTSSTDGGLDGESGSFTCVSSNKHGFIIKNSKNPYAFAYSDGTPYFWMGDQQTTFIDHSDQGSSAYNYNTGTFQSLQDYRQNQGFTNVYFAAHLYVKAGNFRPNENGPNFYDSNPDSLNASFWQMADNRVSYLCDSVGILPGIGLGWPDQNVDGFGAERLIRGMRFLIARYAAYNVMWDLFGEANEYGGGWESWVSQYGNLIKRYDPYNHLASTHLTPGNSYTSIGSDSWCDMIIQQQSSSIPSFVTGGRQYGKPVINVEFDYGNYSAQRKDAWEIMTNGGWCGYGVGNSYEGYIHNSTGLTYMSYLADFFTDTYYWLLQPDQNLITSGTAYCSAVADTEYVAYLPSGGSITLDLTGTSGNYDVEWYNPRDGSTTVGTPVNGGASVNFTAPNNNDWTLHLIKQLNDTTPPSVPTGLNANPVSESQIDLAWNASNDPESGISNYNVYRDGNLIGQPSATNFSDTGLIENTTYTYEVSAINGVGLESGLSTPVNATTMADITPPTILSVSIDVNLSTVFVKFSEPIDENSATNVNNYSIDNNINILSALLQADLKTVTLSTSSHTAGIIYTLTVNNIRDRASNPNTIAPNTQILYVASGQINVTNLNVASGELYESVDSLNNGDLAYIDRNYSSNNIPPSLTGNDIVYIKTANDDKLSQEDPFLEFDINQPVTIYVAHDDRYQIKPDWLTADFTNTSQAITINGTPHTLFKKTFSGSHVALGGNVNPSEPENNDMYTVIIVDAGAVEVDDVPPSVPSRIELYQNYPNPFNPSTTVSFYIPSTEFVILKVYDTLGREIDTLLNNKMVAGTHRVNYSARNLESGVYYYKIQVGTHSETRKMVLIK